MTVPPLRKVTEFPAAVDVDATDLVPIVHDPTGAAASEKASIAQLLQSIEGLTAGTPAAGDSALFVASGVAKKADLAAAYAPLAPASLWIPSTALRPSNGTVVTESSAQFNVQYGLLFPHTADGRASTGQIRLPAWTTFDAYLWWVNPSALAGGVRWNLGRPNSDLTSAAAWPTITFVSTTVTAGAEDVPIRSLLASSVPRQSPGAIRLRREHDHVDDTLDAGALVVALELVQAS